MSYAERKKLFKEFSTIRKRPMITYVTSIRPNRSNNFITHHKYLKRTI